MCNTYCFSTKTTVSHTSLVTFRLYTHCPSCLFLSEFVLYLFTGLSKYLGTKHAFHIDNGLRCLGRFYQSQLVKNIQTDLSYLLNCNKIHFLGYTCIHTMLDYTFFDIGFYVLLNVHPGINPGK